MNTSKALNLFLYSGKADGCKRWDSPTMAASIHIIPRTARDEAADIDAIQSSGIYILFGTPLDADATEALYVGQSKHLHHRVFQDDPNRGIDWNRGILITNEKKALEGHELNYLEHSLYAAAKTAGRYHVTNKNKPNGGTPDDILEAHMSDFLKQIHFLLEAFGITAFKSPAPASADTQTQESAPIFTFYEARGMRTADGFVVLKGSRIEPIGNKKAGSQYAQKLRDEYADAVAKSITQSDLFFRSATAAAMFVYGGNKSGPAVWQTIDDNGKKISLKELEKRSSRPNFHFQSMGIPVGARLIFRKAADGSDVCVTVQDKHSVLYDRQSYCLYPLTEKLLGKKPGGHFLKDWYYDTTNLDTLYNKTYQD